MDCNSKTKAFPINLGLYYSVNLTPAGPLKDWTDGEIFRAVRDNVDKDGKRLVFMAGTNVRFLSDEDMRAVNAFLRNQEPMQNQTPLPPDRPNFLALLLTGANLVQDRPLITEPIVGPREDATAEYGQFMTTFLDCKNCHGEDLSGSTSPINPKGPSLRVVTGRTMWSSLPISDQPRMRINEGHNTPPVSGVLY